MKGQAMILKEIMTPQVEMIPADTSLRAGGSVRGARGRDEVAGMGGGMEGIEKVAGRRQPSAISDVLTGREPTADGFLS